MTLKRRRVFTVAPMLFLVRLAGWHLVLQLIKSKCIPILFYGYSLSTYLILTLDHLIL